MNSKFKVFIISYKIYPEVEWLLKEKIFNYAVLFNDCLSCTAELCVKVVIVTQKAVIAWKYIEKFVFDHINS